MKEMRRKDRAVAREEAMEILKKAEYGILSTVTENGRPYGVPLNYCVIDSGIFIHCAVEGQTVDNILKNKSVSFCVVGNTRILPDKFSTEYESVIVEGEIEEVFDEGKQTALEGLLYKYSPEYIQKGKIYIEKSRQETRVFMIAINKVTGKARKQ